ncbi:hypothetical protein DPMN_047324 [Dreissena polymorpha]|uniref:Uncharacterized protein n=1 Tax=Dreissena polymorpha TaxID=45954 RepID=A0A9D4I1S0_DREPO|nr:hypothetical protein DPMN_047324 [Dreissena polymorpha]
MARQRPTRIPTPHIDRIVIREVQYQFEMNRLKGNFGWVWPMWAGRPRIDRIVIREVRYQFEMNRCRNKEVIVKGNFGWVWSMWAGSPRFDRIVIRECRNEEIIVKGNFGWVWSMWAGSPRVGNGAMHKVQYQFQVNRCRNEEVNKIVARTDGQTAEITTISPRFSKSVGITNLHLMLQMSKVKKERM